MLSILISIIVFLLVVGLLLWAVQELPWIPPQFKQLLRVIIVVFAALVLLGYLFPGVLHLR